jgi:hypothetical protein
MRELKIKITGSGEKYAIAQMLEEVAMLIKSTPIFKLEDGVEWEDGILLTEITSMEE